MSEYPLVYERAHYVDRFSHNIVLNIPLKFEIPNVDMEEFFHHNSVLCLCFVCMFVVPLVYIAL